MSRVAIVTDSASDLTPAAAAAARDHGRPARGQLRQRPLQGRRQPLDRGVLAAHDRARRAVPQDGRGKCRRLPGRVRAALRRRRRGDRLHQRGRDPLGPRSSPPASPATHLPRARDPHRRLRFGLDGRGAPRPDGRRDGGRRPVRRRHRGECSRTARPTSTCTSRSTPSNTSSAAAGSAAAGRPSGRSSRSSRSSRSRTARSRRSTSRGPASKARERVHRAPHRAARGADRDPPHDGRRTSTGSARQLIRRMPGGIDPSLVSVQPVGPSVGPHLGPGRHRRGGPLRSLTSCQRPADTCRHGTDGRSRWAVRPVSGPEASGYTRP